MLCAVGHRVLSVTVCHWSPVFPEHSHVDAPRPGDTDTRLVVLWALCPACNTFRAFSAENQLFGGLFLARLMCWLGFALLGWTHGGHRSVVGLGRCWWGEGRVLVGGSPGQDPLPAPPFAAPRDQQHVLEPAAGSCSKCANTPTLTPVALV